MLNPIPPYAPRNNFQSEPEQSISMRRLTNQLHINLDLPSNPHQPHSVEIASAFNEMILDAAQTIKPRRAALHKLPALASKTAAHPEIRVRTNIDSPTALHTVLNKFEKEKIN